MTPSDAPLLQISGLTKRFGTLLANDHVDLVVRAGETVDRVIARDQCRHGSDSC